MSRKYRFDPVMRLDVSWNNQRIRLSDNATLESPNIRLLQPWGYKVCDSKVTTEVNGRDLSLGAPVEIRPDDPRTTRYFNWIAFGVIHDVIDNAEKFLVVQRYATNSSDWYRALSVDGRGYVSVSAFPEDKWLRPKMETYYINLIAHPLRGYYTDITNTYPGLFVPLLFPIGTFFIGLVLIWIGRRPRGPAARV